MAEEIAEELEKLIREAAKQPGISELMAIYGQYDEYLKQSSEYLAGIRARDIITTSNSPILRYL